MNELTKGLKTIAENKLQITLRENGDVKCTFSKDVEEGSPIVQTIYRKVKIFVTGDLAFYAMVLGKEGMSPHWCHLCKLSRKEFQDMNAEGDKWTNEAMKATAEEVATDGKWRLGVKSKLWWPFIDIQNYVVPLLHTLIGIGNDILFQGAQRKNRPSEALLESMWAVFNFIVMCLICISVRLRVD